jgi:hypothetical protein
MRLAVPEDSDGGAAKCLVRLSSVLFIYAEFLGALYLPIGLLLFFSLGDPLRGFSIQRYCLPSVYAIEE